MSDVRQLTRLRWGVRAVLALGVAASVCANILHAQPNLISQTIAAWPPIALLLTVELISRVPVHRRALAAARLVATAAIAGIAAWVSYHHMAAVAARYGETGASAYLLPLSVDGLIVVGSVCLVELGGRLSAATAPAPHAASASGPADKDEPAAAAASDHRASRRDQAAAAPTVDTAPPVTAAAPSASPGTGTETDAARQPTPAAAAPIYQPTSEEDAAMYQAWHAGIAAGREPTGADLARAAGRRNDASGAGRRAARRYRDAHARAAQSTQDVQPVQVGSPATAGTSGVAEAAAATAASPVPAVAAAPPPPARADAAATVQHNGHRPTLTGGAR